VSEKEPERLIPLGEIVTTHGIRGWLKLKPYNSQTTGLLSPTKVVLARVGVHSHHCIEASRAHKAQLLIKLEGINGIEEAETLVGSTVAVAEQTLQPLEPGEYYYYQALGLDVYDTQGKWIGVLTRIWSKKGGDLCVVRGKTKEYLIPAVKEIIEKIDLPAKKIIINPPLGLLEL
jgi:16S rRNA processing protein RimM